MVKEKKSKNFMRIVSSLLGFPIIALLMVFGNALAWDILLTCVAIISTYEFTNCFKSTKKANPSSWYLYIVSAMLLFTHRLSDIALKEIFMVVIPISLLVLVAEMFFSKGKKNIMDVAVSILGICYIPLMLVFFEMIREHFNEGRFLVWYIFSAAWGSDVLAYCIGRRFGKHKFTDISPNKSIEGCVAGVFGAVLIALALTLVFNSFFSLRISYLMVAIIVAILSVIGQIGDLAASSMKRYCGLKDFGELIPGHGGMLDRIDSVIFIIPFAYILLGILV